MLAVLLKEHQQKQELLRQENGADPIFSKLSYIHFFISFFLNNSF
jgi:hypothetical protein